MEELEDDGKFPLLSAKAAVGFKKTVQGEFLREIERMEEQLDKKGKQLNGRQLYWLILQELKRSDMDMEIQEWRDLFKIKMRGENLRGYQNAWKKSLDRMSNPPTEDKYLMSFYEPQIRRCAPFASTFKLYMLECNQKKDEKTCCMR